MATLETLAEAGLIHRMLVPLPARRQPGRRMFLTTHCARWLKHDLGKVRATHFGNDVPAKDQVRLLLIAYRSGEPLELSRQFKQLRPAGDGVWELKTGDVRVFGWFVHQDCFVAADAADKTWIAENSGPRYLDLIQSCVIQRNALDIDPPKFIPSGNAFDVITN